MGVRYEENDDDEKKNYRYYCPQDTYRFADVIFVDPLDAGQSCYLCAFMGRDRPDYCKSGSKYPRAVVAFPEIRDQILPSDRSNGAVRQNALKSISDLDAVFPILHRDCDKDSVVLTFLAEFPFFRCPQGETLDIFAVEALYRKDEHLRCGFLLKFRQVRIQLTPHIVSDDAGEIDYIILRHCRRRRRRGRCMRRQKSCSKNYTEDEFFKHGVHR